MSTFAWTRGNTAKPMVECHLRDAVSYAPLSGATVKLVYVGPHGRAERTMTIVDATTGHVKYVSEASDNTALDAAGKFKCRFVVTFNDGTIQDYPNSGSDFIDVSLPL